MSAAKLSIGFIAAYWLICISLIFLRPDLDPTWHTISEWAIGPYGWLMSTAFALSALSYACLFITVRPLLHGWAGNSGKVLLLICVAGTFGVAVFTTDPMEMLGTPTTRGMLHIACGGTALMLFPFAALFISFNLGLRRLAFLPLFGLVCFIAYTVVFVVPKGDHAYGPGVHIGLPPRFAFLTYGIWLVTIQLIRLSKPVG